jgi:hypothetical protein
MARLSTRVCVTLAGVVVSAALAAAQGTGATATALKRDSEKMQKNVAASLLRAATPPPPTGKAPSPLRTSFTDRELNAWLSADGKANVPTGLVSPSVAFTGPGKLTVHGLIDLDAVRKSRERSMLDPMAYLTGQMEISLRGTLTGRGGQGVFDVESASLGNVAVH